LLGVFANNRRYSCRNANTFDEPSALINVLEEKLVHPVIGSVRFQQNLRISRLGSGWFDMNAPFDSPEVSFWEFEYRLTLRRLVAKSR